MDLHHGDERRVEVVGLGRLGVQDFDGEGAPRDGEDWALEEVGGVLLSIKRGRGADELEVLPALEQPLEQAEEHVRVDGPLVCLVEHDERIARELRVHEALAQQHAVGHVLDDRLGRGAILEAD